MKQKNGEHPFGDAGQLILLGVFLAVWAGDSFFLRYSTFLSDSVPRYIRLVVMGIAFAAALYLSFTGHAAVSHERRFTGVITTGAFRHVRHPLYLASMLIYIGLAVSTASLLSLALLLPIFAFYNHIASHEERLMETKFGDEYRVYKVKTGKWVPRARGRE